MILLAYFFFCQRQFPRHVLMIMSRCESEGGKRIEKYGTWKVFYFYDTGGGSDIISSLEENEMLDCW